MTRNSKWSLSRLFFFCLTVSPSLGGARALSEAERCFQEAAKLGSCDGMFKLYEMYTRQKPMKDSSCAREWLLQAAVAGHKGAAHKLGSICLQSNADTDLARFWFERGSPESKKALAAMEPPKQLTPQECMDKIRLALASQNNV